MRPKPHTTILLNTTHTFVARPSAPPKQNWNKKHTHNHTPFCFDKPITYGTSATGTLGVSSFSDH